MESNNNDEILVMTHRMSTINEDERTSSRDLLHMMVDELYRIQSIGNIVEINTEVKYKLRPFGIEDTDDAITDKIFDK
jgi:hypothetical protein